MVQEHTRTFHFQARHRPVWPLVLSLLLTSMFAVAKDFPVADCMECHRDDEDVPPLDLAAFMASAHGEAELSCTDCHSDIAELPHADTLAAVSCAECHDEEAEKFLRSVHGAAVDALTGEAAVSCASCHGVHDVHAATDARSRVGVARLTETCMVCHEDQALGGGDGADDGLTRSYLLSVHGQAYPNGPVTRKANCGDCHDVHDTRAVRSDDSRLGRRHVTQTCVACHTEVGDIYFSSAHGKLAREGSPDVAVCTDCHGEHRIRSAQERVATRASKQIAETCANCHENEEILARHKIDMVSPSTLYRNSIHGRALIVDGNKDAAACHDCHGHHGILGGHESASFVNKMNIAKTCGTCHAETRRDYEESVHAHALSRGVHESAVCTDCHGEHTILGHLDPSSPVYATRLAKEVCGRCHDSVVMTGKFGLSGTKVSTYRASYHGLASRLGDTQVANCASCHEAHRILPQSDPESSVNAANLKETCGQCHPGASDRFVEGLVHISTSDSHQVVIYWVRRIYLVVIFCACGFMLLHNMVIISAYIREKYARQKQMACVVRFPRTFVAQHLLLVSSFILLVVTGFSLSFPDSFFSSVLRDWFGWKEGMRSFVHRVAATLMMVTMVWHVISLLFSRRGRRELKALSLRKQDGLDMIANVLYHLGVKRMKPEFDRYDYTEKIEYWALMWGSVVMILTGLMMWFPFESSEWLGLSKIWVDVASVIHYYEAWLAALAIVIWHLFFVAYHPDEYPMALTWLTRTLPVHAMKERHSKELEQLEKEGKVLPPEEPTADDTSHDPAG